MLDSLPALQREKYIVVDSSLSRQSYSVCGKLIHPPQYIDEFNVTTVIITVVRRKDEIIKQLALHPSIANIYLPGIKRTDHNHACFNLKKI